MRKIYIVLTYTGTPLSKLIRLYTREEYSHVSIALDEDLGRMYSFGRLKPYNAFIGGFVREGVNFGTFRRFKNTKCSIKCIEITDDQYYELKRIIKKFEKKKKIYSFNVIGLFATALNIKVQKENSFYCAEFVKYALEESHIVSALPDLIKPEDFHNLEISVPVYEGLLRKYAVTK